MIKKPEAFKLDDADLGALFKQWFGAQRFSAAGAWDAHEVKAIRSMLRDIDTFAKEQGRLP